MAKKTRASKILVIICVITFICIFSCAVSWYFPIDPVSPPETNLDDVPSFNALFGDTDHKWSFLFRKKNKYYITDIFGQKNEVILDIDHITNNGKSDEYYGVSISPNHRFLAVNYSSSRDSSGQYIDKLLILDLNDHSIIDIPASLDGFELDWWRSPYWLDSNVFLVTMRTWSPQKKVKFLVYDLRNLNKSKLIEFDPCGVSMAFNEIDRVLVVSDEWCARPNEVHYWAIDIQGKRLANSDEVTYYNEIMSDDDFLEASKEFSLCEDCPTIRTEPVSDWTPAVDDLGLPWLEVLLAGRFNYNNYWRDNIYFDDKLVRITDSEFMRIIWESELNLFFILDGDRWFQFDIDGHYRFWYEGDYVGKIPKTILND